MGTRWAYTLPGGISLTLRELTVGEVERIAVEAAAAAMGQVGTDDGGRLAAATAVQESALRRRTCLVELGGKTSADYSPAELLADLTPKQATFIDAAIRQLHDVTRDEVEAFLGNAQRLEG